MQQLILSDTCGQHLYMINLMILLISSLFFPLASRHFKEKMQQQAKKDEARWRLLVSKVISTKKSVGLFSGWRSAFL